MKPLLLFNAEGTLQQVLSGAGLPEEVQSTLLRWQGKARQEADNPSSMFSHGTSDKYPLELLEQYRDSPSVQQYLQAKYALYAGMSAMMDADYPAGIKLLAVGYALAQS